MLEIGFVQTMEMKSLGRCLVPPVLLLSRDAPPLQKETPFFKRNSLLRDPFSQSVPLDFPPQSNFPPE